MKPFFYLIVVIFFGCTNKPINQKITDVHCDSSSLSGILIFNANVADQQRHSTEIFNGDLSLYGKIQSTGAREPYLDSLQNNIRAYYPDYYIIHFDAAIQNDSIYCVRIGEKVKIIKADSFLTFLSWEEYITKFYCVTDAGNPLRNFPREQAPMVDVKDYTALSFRCLEVNGEWVKVQCFADCEGCPGNNQNITGWIRWKKNGVILIKQKYAC